MMGPALVFFLVTTLFLDLMYNLSEKWREFCTGRRGNTGGTFVLTASKSATKIFCALNNANIPAATSEIPSVHAKFYQDPSTA